MSTKKAGKQFSDILRPGTASAHATSRPIIAPKHPHIDPVVNVHPAAPLHSSSSRPRIIMLDNEQPMLVTEVGDGIETNSIPNTLTEVAEARQDTREHLPETTPSIASLAHMQSKTQSRPKRSLARKVVISILALAVLAAVIFNGFLVSEYLSLQ